MKSVLAILSIALVTLTAAHPTSENNLVARQWSCLAPCYPSQGDCQDPYVSGIWLSTSYPGAAKSTMTNAVIFFNSDI